MVPESQISEQGTQTVHFRWNEFLMIGLLAASTVFGCAPEPTEPAMTDLAGTWTATTHVFALSNIKIQMIQEPLGIVSGKWFADGDGGTGGCEPKIPCKAFGELIGRNTVSQVEIELLGAGRFDGVLLTGPSLRGTFTVSSDYDSITFVRTSTRSTANLNAARVR